MKLGEVLNKFLNGKSILIVDDEEKIRDLIGTYLRKANFEKRHVLKKS